MHHSNIPPDTCPVPESKSMSCLPFPDEFYDKYYFRLGSNYVHHVIEKRHSYYLWLRTPELIFNPQGGWHHPIAVMIRDHSLTKRSNDDSAILMHGKEVLYYHCIKGPVYYDRDRPLEYGIIDGFAVIIDNDLVESGRKELDQTTRIILAPFGFIAIVLIKAYMLPFYVAHDVIKIPLMPIAAIYFATKEEEK